MTGELVRFLSVIAAACTFVSCSHAAAAASDQELEKGLLDALRFNTKTSERVGNSGKAIQAYMAEGVVDRKPNRRADYTDYYLVRKPAKLMGHDLVMIEEEYLTRYVGCCVSPGMGVTVRINGPSDNLGKFAKENRCSYSDDVKLQDEINSIGIKFRVPPGEYAALSCRDRDANR